MKKWVHLLPLLIGLLSWTSCQSAPQPSKVGVHLLLDDGRGAWSQASWPDHLQAAQATIGAGGYVTQLIRLDDLEPQKWQYFLDLCAELELRPLLRLATVYDRAAGMWVAPTADADGRYQAIAQQYAAFIGQLTWAEPPLIIIGNEPNHGDEWGGVPDPAAYGRFLLDVGQAIKTQRPDALILNAGLDLYAPHTNGEPFVNGFVYLDAETFLDEMVAAEPTVLSILDGWSSHPYPLGPFTRPPWEQTYQRDMLNGAVNPAHRPPPDGVYNRGVNGYEWELWKLAQYGVTDLPVYITETGWRHAETAVATATDSGPGDLPATAVMATYLELALRGNTRFENLPTHGWTPWLDDDRVAAVTFFAFNGRPIEWGHTNWLILDQNGRIQGNYFPDFYATVTP